MASTYHPIYSGLWNDDALEGTTFECHAFFAFLCSNDHVRPSGIYRVTDEQLVAETTLPLRRIRTHLSVLVQRGRILRDGAWIFVCGYFKRQPKQERLLNGVRSDIQICSSIAILKAFGLRYSHFNKWSADRLLTLSNPMNHFVSTEQSNAEQSNAEQSRAVEGFETVGRRSGPSTRPEAATPPTPAIAFRVNDEIQEALRQAPRLGAVPRLWSVEFWRAEVRANGELDLPAEILKAEAWMVANPHKAPRKDLPRFLHNWFSKADRPEP